MPRSNHQDDRQQAQMLLEQLVEAASHLDADDLRGLAQMHSWCEALVDLSQVGDVGEDENRSDSGIGAEQAETLMQIAHSIEAVILDEVSDVTQEFENVTQQLNEITRAILDTTPGSSTTSAKTSVESKTKLTIAPSSSKNPSNSKKKITADTEAAILANWDNDLPSLDPIPSPAVSANKPAASTDKPAASVHVTAANANAPNANVPATHANHNYQPYVQKPLILDPKEAEFVRGFVQEAREHIEAIELAVLEVERAPGNTARVDDLFRPFHTIEGMSGFLNLRDIKNLTHEAETLLDQARKGKRQITPGVIDLILAVVDILKAQINSVDAWEASPTCDPVPQPSIVAMLERLHLVITGSVDPQVDEDRGRPARAATATSNDSGVANAGVASVSADTVGNGPAAIKTNESIRIDIDKLDAMIDLVGELVIAQTLVHMHDEVINQPKLAKDVTQVTKIVRDLQEMAMSMRMVPIGPTFNKMARLIRDVSHKVGKTVELIITGNETELDKTVIQGIGDPLVHMIRNAVDHGIETPEVRAAAGKPEVGHVYLHAGHEGGNIVISLRDDGKGLDPAALRAKGIERGIIQPRDELTEQQIFQLIFAPGFSTAAQVTDISGRGVGMDVVRRNIEQLHGRVEINSTMGEGTTFAIRLPLTLAIIDGMVVRLGSERFIVPTISIQQALRPKPEMITTVQHRGEVLNVRGEMIPLIQLGELFGLTGRIDPCDAMVVIAHCEGRFIGLVVEELIGQQQVVIKTLGERFEQLQGVSGAAILGDGRVGLILEMSGIVESHGRHVSSDYRIDRSKPESKLGLRLTGMASIVESMKPKNQLEDLKRQTENVEMAQ